MKKKTLTLTLLLTTLLHTAQADVDPNFYIYLCFGQSNMEGNARPETVDLTGVPERFKMLACVNFNNPKRTIGQWYTAVPPLVREGTGLGMADWFGRTMVQSLPTNVTIGVVDVAVGGTKIEGFMPTQVAPYIASLNPSTESWLINYFKAYDNNPYKRLVDMARIAQQSGVIKGILLHQGESNNTQQDWPQKVKKIYDQLLADLSLNPADVPLILGETVSQASGGVCWGHNAVIAQVPTIIPNAHVVSSQGCPQGDQNDGLHFSPLGYRMMGYRYALAALHTLHLTPPLFSFYDGALTPNTNATYTSTTRTMTAHKSGAMVSWTYPDAADFSPYHYLVVKLKQPQTCDAEIRINNFSPAKLAYLDDFGDRTTLVVHLPTARYSATPLDPTAVGRIIFRAKRQGTLVFDDVFLTSDPQYAPTAVPSPLADRRPFSPPLYSLDGRLSPGDPSSLRPGLYLHNGKKLLVK